METTGTPVRGGGRGTESLGLRPRRSAALPLRKAAGPSVRPCAPLCTAGSSFRLALLVLVLGLGLLPTCAGAADCVWNLKNAFSLGYTFNFSASGLPLCAVEAMVNGSCIPYTCNGLKAKLNGSLEMMWNVRETLNQQCERCVDVVEELQSSLLYNEPDFVLSSVQGVMRCQQESDGSWSPLLHLYYKKQRCLRIGPLIGKKVKPWKSRNRNCRYLKNLVDSPMNNVVRISSEVCAMWPNQSTVPDPKEDAAQKVP
ncbi:uncharacterized protein LOC123821788 isoform X2 [Phyllostomus hastatus]|uniref:uncharacterized protein LOC123821788 isoform X2 n=1 Tax=Phyllostomus hastatus TaxID=9423 RepID=UPI001E681CB0|nr:uncharacterized protein LOC123821788 isoform X2 [Phyllostomus hastatus]